MRKHILQFALPLGDRAGFHACLRSHSLIRARLKEFADPNSSRISCRAACRKDVVGAYGFVAVCDRGFFSYKQRSVVGESLEEELNITDVQLEVFWCITVA